MSNDRRASELLSKSFHGKLTSDEQIELEASIEDNDDAANFARLSRMIQDSVTDLVTASESGNPAIAPGLSPEAKQRLRDSVQKARMEAPGRTSEIGDRPGTPNDVLLLRSGDSRSAKSRFTLLRRIGDGGLGTVWLARDEDLKRTVAIKEMLPAKADSPKHLQRFQREATITGLLEHPNVVPLYLFGVNEQTGKPFYAMRFLGKQTLTDAIGEYHARREAGQAEQIELHRLLTVFLDVCQAIAYAHSRGVVHRDLKPENVALDSFGQVIVLDWGIAKLLSDGELAVQASLDSIDPKDSMLTRTLEGEVVGTPLYMAPEQAAGDLDNVDERTDVFGLGAILFAILTGCAPHHNTCSKNPSDGIRDLLKAIAEGTIPMPHELNSGVSRDLEMICARAMSRQRYARHNSAQALADDVERWMAGQHEKRKQYEAMRLEGNALGGHLGSCIRDFGTNVRFMSTLPPIQGLIDADHGEDHEGQAVWRERLGTIFRGLLKSNSDFISVAYSRVLDREVQELVRAEKPNPESEARVIPKSRLMAAPLGPFGEVVMRKKPDDVHVAISPCTELGGSCAPLRLEAAAPVFDRDEEPFGMVVIEGDFDRLIAAQVQGRNRTTDRVLVVNDSDIILVEDSQNLRGMVGQRADDVLHAWPNIKQEIQLNGEFVDVQSEVFATRVFLVPRASAVTLVLLTD